MAHLVRNETSDDFAAVAEVVRAAFVDEPQVAEMVAAVRASPGYRPGLAFVATVDQGVVGFVMLSTVSLVDENGTHRDVLSLTPLAVMPSFQRRGIGSALVAAALDAADRQREPLVVLEGSPDYYSQLGFRFAGDFDIQIALPDWAPAAAAQVFLLRCYDRQFRGRVEYPPAIAAVSG